VDPILNGSGVYAERELTDGYTLILRANNIRRERTGVHAKLEVFINRGLLAWTNCNIERDEDRTRIANSAYKQVNEPLNQALSKDRLKSDLDIFCNSTWDVMLATQVPVMVPGDALLPVNFVVDPYVIEGGGTILFTYPDSGKSYTGMLMAVSVDAGHNALWPCEQQPAMFINLERSKESIQRRLGCVNTALGLDPARPLLVMNERGKTLADIREPAERAIKEHGVKFIILDSLSRAGLGDLNENRPGNAAIDILNDLGESWLALGHSPRSTDDHLFGSIMFDAGADILIRLASERKGDTRGIRLDIVKANDVGARPRRTLAYEFDGQGLTHVRESTDDEFEQLAATEPRSNEEKIKRYLLEAGKATSVDIAQATDLSDGVVRKMLSRHDDVFVKVFEPGASKVPVVWGVKSTS